VVASRDFLCSGFVFAPAKPWCATPLLRGTKAALIAPPDRMAAGVIATTESDAPPKSKVKDSSLTALSRTVALLFSRPVRLFRPAKLSGVAALSYAAQAKGHGDVYSFAGLRSLFRAEGFFFVPRQMLPPLVINGVLGFQLFFTYS
jgi:hypothetical protein